MRDFATVTRFIRVLLALAICMGLGYSLLHIWLKRQGVLDEPAPIRIVRVQGALQYQSELALREVLAPLVKSGFWQLDIKKVENVVRDMPWIEQVSVARRWPDILEIQIHERMPYVRWGATELLDGHGRKFLPDDISPFAALPLLDGPPGLELHLLTRFNALNAALQEYGLQLMRLQLSERHAWLMELSDGMHVVVGRQEPMDVVLRLQRLFDSLGVERVRTLLSVDLRYPNGFAVTFKGEAQAS